jgi:hypothetical protein
MNTLCWKQHQCLKILRLPAIRRDPPAQMQELQLPRCTLLLHGSLAALAHISHVFSRLRKTLNRILISSDSDEVNSLIFSHVLESGAALSPALPCVCLLRNMAIRLANTDEKCLLVSC